MRLGAKMVSAKDMLETFLILGREKLGKEKLSYEKAPFLYSTMQCMHQLYVHHH